jgi:hypothetical protein
VKESAQKELSEHWVKEIGVATKDHTLPVQRFQIPHPIYEKQIKL